MLLGAAPLARAEVVQGVARVIDGDTLAFQGQHVRLSGVDAPEMAQGCTRDGQVWACGLWARQRMVRLLNGQVTVCTGDTHDRYGRLVAVCRVGGRDIAADLVRDGVILAYPRYSMAYVGLENSARAARRGVWAGEVQQPAAFRAGEAVRPAREVAAGAGCRIKGNISAHGQIYHLPGQADYDRTRIDARRGERWFCSEAEAQAAGWRRARR